MADEPWYKDGLRFKCTQCGNCCTGAPGYVWVNQEEIEAIAAEVGESDVEAFEAEYVRKVGIRRSLREFPNGDCVFFDGESRKCTVYQARPRANAELGRSGISNLKSPQAWVETCEVCPGSGTGKLYHINDIESQRKVFHV